MKEALAPDVHKPKFESTARTFMYLDAGDDAQTGSDFMEGHPTRIINSLGLLDKTPGGKDIKVRVSDADGEGIIRDRIEEHGAEATVVFRRSPQPAETALR